MTKGKRDLCNPFVHVRGNKDWKTEIYKIGITQNNALGQTQNIYKLQKYGQLENPTQKEEAQLTWWACELNSWSYTWQETQKKTYL